MRSIFFAVLTVFSAYSAAYDIQKDLPVNYELVKAGGKPVALLGTQPAVGLAAPDFKVVDNKFNTKQLADFVGQPLLISVVASLDTGVCSIQTKKFNEEVANLAQDITVISISADLPFAQKRFCQLEGIDKVKTYSDSVWRDFAMNYGVLIKDMGLLTRSIFVIAPDGKLAYKEIVPQLSAEPDYESALAALSALSEQSQQDEEAVENTEESEQGVQQKTENSEKN